MIDRRTLLGVAAAIPLATSAHAQVLPPAGYATPAGTSPFPPEVFRERRAKVMAAMKNGIAVIYGAKDVPSDAAVAPPFQQNGDFAWLTGIVDEPGAALLLAPEERTIREMLFLPSRNPESERWVVERLALGSELERRTGFARVYRTGEIGSRAVTIAGRRKQLHFLGPIVGPGTPVPPTLELYGQIAQRVPGTTIIDDSGLLPSLRVVKEPRELVLMRKAAAATRRGHLAAMRALRPGGTERQLKELMEAEFRAGGGDGLSYDSIVGAGRNAASLHYTGGSGPLMAGSLVLIDAAASVGGYACDVTRTLPVGGRFSPEQRRLYELVLEAQTAAVAKLRAGAYLEDLSEIARNVFRRAGLVDGFYHGLGHFVGLDVHDAGDTSRPLPAGAVITIEPGLYDQSQNYGIRIEDDYLITATGSECLTEGVPKTVAAIERFMGAGGGS